MSDYVDIPQDTLLRMALISEKHLKGEYEYMRLIVVSHEKEIAWLSFGLAILAAINYTLLIKIYRMEKANASDS